MRVSLPMHTAGFEDCLESTFPAAYPRRSTKSGVIGLSPIVPRTPSVPKYLRLTGISLPYGDHVACFFNVVDTKYCSTGLQREQGHRQTPGQAILHRSPGDPAECGLAREPRHDRQVGEGRQILEKGEVVRRSFAEAETRVDGNALGGNACGASRMHAALQELAYLAHHVIVVGIALHRGGFALLVHETNRASAVSDCFHRPGRSKGIDIV